MDTKATTTIRAPQEWIDDVDQWAGEHGVASRTAAILLLTKLGMVAVQNVKLPSRDVLELSELLFE
jgi:hypothetical protein